MQICIKSHAAYFCKTLGSSINICGFEQCLATNCEFVAMNLREVFGRAANKSTRSSGLTTVRREEERKC